WTARAIRAPLARVRPGATRGHRGSGHGPKWPAAPCHSAERPGNRADIGVQSKPARCSLEAEGRNQASLTISDQFTGLDSDDRAQSIGSRCAPANRQEFRDLCSTGGAGVGNSGVTSGACNLRSIPDELEVALKALLINKLQRTFWKILTAIKIHSPGLLWHRERGKQVPLGGSDDSVRNRVSI